MTSRPACVIRYSQCTLYTYASVLLSCLTFLCLGSQAHPQTELRVSYSTPTALTQLVGFKRSHHCIQHGDRDNCSWSFHAREARRAGYLRKEDPLSNNRQSRH